MRRGLLILTLVWFLLPPRAGAHVGNPNAIFEGMAGPYPLWVMVRAPGVVPGLAEVIVRSEGPGVTSVTARPVKWDAGKKGAPPADVARPVPGDSALYSAQLWLMDSGAYSVYVTVSGPKGSGTAIVPVNSIATQRMPMDRRLGVALLALGGILFAGAISIVGASVRESTLAPGADPGPGAKRVAAGAMFGGAALLALVIFGGGRWWQGVDRAHQGQLYKPAHISVSLFGPSTMRITIDDASWGGRNWTPLVPDHGKLMHCFLIREPALDAFAHLHPVARSGNIFESALPPLPAGRYRLYADITHQSGFAETLVSNILVPAAGVPSLLPADPDDSWARAGTPAGPGATYRTADGTSVTMAPAVLRAGREESLHFSVRDEEGNPAVLEPYMGMASHAVITRPDGTLFVHLHPMGTVSMASQQLFEARDRGQEHPELETMSTMHQTISSSSSVDLPFAFPEPGSYRIFVQVKTGEAIRTAVFDVMVQ